MSLKVERLLLHPIKSCGVIEVEEFQIGESGPQIQVDGVLVGDREWMFVDTDGKFLTQRSLPLMARIRPFIEKSGFSVEIFGQKFQIPLQGDQERMRVSVWGKEVDAARIPGEFNQAASEALGKTVQLVRFDQSSDREALIKGRGLGVQTRFTDSQPYLVITAESLQDLNSRLGKPISSLNFRPNIVVSGAAEAYEEDHWKYLGADDIVFEGTKACGRCKIITVDPKTGVIPSPEPLVELSRYRKKESAVLFGHYFLSRSFGETVKKGMRFQAQKDPITG